MSMQRWLGKVAVVTGANSGIGAAIARKLVENGINVVGFDKNTDSSNQPLNNTEGELRFFKADLTREEDIIGGFKWAKDNMGPVSILVNNAGVFNRSSLIEGETEDWKSIIDVNLLGLCIASREAIKSMREHNIDGHIVNIKSIAGHAVYPGLQMYAPAKFAVGAATDTVRLELNAIRSKIKIGCISPSVVDTPMVRANVKGLKETDPHLKPEDIANAVEYILSTPPHVQIQELIIRPVGDLY